MPMVNFYSHLSVISDPYDSTTVIHICMVLRLLLSKELLTLFFIIMWYHTAGCKNIIVVRILFIYNIDFFICFIIIDEDVSASGHDNDVDGNLNSRGKWMLKLVMEIS